MKNLIASIIAALVIAWSLVWSVCVWVDKEHCESFDAQYHSTSVALNGYCDVMGIKVRAGALSHGG